MKLILFIFLLSFSACSKKNSLKSTLPIPKNQNSLIEEKEDKKQREIPLIQFSNVSNIKVQVIGKEINSSFSFELSLEKEKYLSQKMKRIVNGASNEILDLRDLFKYQFNINQEERSKLFEGLRFDEFSNYSVNFNTEFNLKSSSVEGRVKDLSFSVSHLSNEEAHDYRNIYRYENQRDSILLTSLEKKEYSFHSHANDYSEFINKVITRDSFIYEIVDYQYEEESLNDWLESARQYSGGYLIINSGDKTFLHKVKEDQDIESFLKNIDPSFEVSINGNVKTIGEINGDWRKIGFSDLDSKLSDGEVVGLYLYDEKLNEGIERNVIRDNYSSNFRIVQNRKEELEFYIQLRSKKSCIDTTSRVVPIFQANYSQCSSDRTNCKSIYRSDVPREYCTVLTDNYYEGDLVNVEMLDPNSVFISISGKRYTLGEIVRSRKGTVQINSELIYIKLKTFKGTEDQRVIEVTANSKLSNEVVKKNSHNCVVGQIDQLIHPDGLYSFLVFEGDGISSSFSKELVGEELLMDLFIIK
jgi:hypothetical protein